MAFCLILLGAMAGLLGGAGVFVGIVLARVSLNKIDGCTHYKDHDPKG